MNLNLEDRIRERAYFLWLDSSGAGDATYFWLIAEREVLAEAAIKASRLPLEEEASAAPNSVSEHPPARRVNALVQLDPGGQNEKAPRTRVAG